MTEKTYERNSYLKELDTVVTECEKCDDGYRIKFRETIFFPEEGGQYSDTGKAVFGTCAANIIRGELIGDPREGDTDVRYLTDCEIPEGTPVHLVLDWEKRFSRMQNHSGEHIVSGLIHNMFGYDNIGFHLSDDEPVTLVVNGKLTAEQIKEIEIRANDSVYADLEITDSYPSAEELSSVDYRSKIDIKAQVRLITIGGDAGIVSAELTDCLRKESITGDGSGILDICACCAPHVASTGSIGIIRILGSAAFKGGTQLSILCGQRALDHIVRSMDELDVLAASFSTSADKVPELVAKLKNENADLKGRLSGLSEAVLMSEAEKPESGNLVFTDIDLTPASMKNIFNRLCGIKTGYTGIFVGNDTEGYRYFAGAGNSSSETKDACDTDAKKYDARELAGLMRENLGAKGGGSSEMVQGRVKAVRTEIEDLWKKLV